VFLATLTYGAVAVPILHEFMPDQVHNIVNHSEAKLLFVGDMVAPTIKEEEMPHLEGILFIPDFSVLVSRSEKLTYAREHLNEIFGHKYPKYFRQEHVNYYKEESPEELLLINYTSGTTGFSKGVMIPARALWSNYDFATGVLGDKVSHGDNIISILPMAHMYGMMFEFLFEFLIGCHIYFLTRIPSPAIIAQAFAEVKPAVIIAVPLVIEKIIRKKVFPKIQNNLMKLLLNMPVVSKTTECAPIIAYSDYKTFVPGSCGRAVVHMQVEIESSDPQNIPGEIIVKGLNVMLGYYKNEEATNQVLDSNGWYHTGDLGIMDKDGNIFIKGRSKNMLLGSNGQNIYPEEIEDTLALVGESIVLQREEKLVALVHPDMEEAESMGFSMDDIQKVMAQNLQTLNDMMPGYSKVSDIILHEEEFEKTPKKSIKRYLYK